MTRFLITAVASPLVVWLLSHVVETLRRAPKAPDAMPWAPDLKSAYVIVEGARPRYVTLGTGPVLVLLHTLRGPFNLSAVGLSRSPFAARFTALVGESPMSYLKRWRLQRAAALLRHDAVTLSSVAERVGYESTAAFSRAFTRFFGVSPGRYRSRAAVGGAADATRRGRRERSSP